MQETNCNYHLSDEAVDQFERVFGHITTPRARPVSTKTRMLQYRSGATLEQISQELGCSRERVRQIEVAALEKCRVWCERNGYRLGGLLG